MTARGKSGEIRGRIRLHRAGGAGDCTGQGFIEFVELDNRIKGYG